MKEKPMADRRFVAIVTYTCQTGPESWEPQPRSMLCNPDTTLREIAEWYGRIFSPGAGLEGVQLSEPYEADKGE